MISIGSGTARRRSAMVWIVARALYTGTTTESFGMSMAPLAATSGSPRLRGGNVGLEQREPEIVAAPGRERAHQIVHLARPVRLPRGQQRPNRAVLEIVRGDPVPFRTGLVQQRGGCPCRGGQIAAGQRLAE